MSATSQAVTVRYWASARAAAGVAEEVVAVGAPATVQSVLDEVRRRHPDGGLARVLATCSLLVGERPVGAREHADVVVGADEVVEVLPPFAGG